MQIIKNILRFIFSIKNINNHKVLTIFGIKFKFFNKNKFIYKTLTDVNEKLNPREIESILKQKFDKLIEDLEFQRYWNMSSLYNYFEEKAHLETIEFIKKNIKPDEIMLLKDRWVNLAYCAKKAKQVGLFIECGVHTGKSINFLADKMPQIVIHGFDSFEGLPEEWSGFTMEEGHFDLKGEMPEVRENVRLHKGWFRDTLTQFLKEKNEKIAFLHVDCDIYQSTVDVLNAVEKYLQIGTIIVFDEFFNYPNWQEHEYKAFKEFVDRTKINYRFISIGHLQVGLKIIKIGEK